MDIWRWVGRAQRDLYENGNERLADLMDELPSAVVNLEFDQVDAMVPEALALAREAGEPWIEVFIRHWNLQSQVFNRNRVEQSLPEAVALLDFAHRDDTRDCPQSVCVVQDLAACYGQVDGPGYVQERLAIADETLDRIDSTWGCYTCISGERADALLDDGRYEEVLTFLDRQDAVLKRGGRASSSFSMRKSRVEALVRLGRYEEAKAYNDKAYNHGGGDGYAFGRSMDVARIAAYQGSYPQALEELPGYAEIQRKAEYYMSWTETSKLLALAGQIDNDAELDGQFAELAEALAVNGANYNAAVLSLRRAELALARGDKQAAEAACARVDTATSKLRRPEFLRKELQKLRNTASAGAG